VFRTIITALFCNKNNRLTSAWKNMAVFILLNRVITSLLFSVGCHKEQQVIDLYVEAVMFSELGKN